jgi:MFS family permease
VTRGAWSPPQRLLTAGLVFMVTAIGFEGLAVPTVLPATLAQLGGLPLYGWAFSAFWLSSLVGITLSGVEADRRGPRGPMLAGSLLFAAGLLIAGQAPSMEWVVVGRIVQGLGAGAIASIVYVVIGRGYDAAARPRMIAVISSAWVLPGLIGPALAGYVAQESSWRWTFLALAPLLPLAAAALAGSLGRLGPEAPVAGHQRTLDPVRDAVVLALGAALLLWALTQGQALLVLPAVVVSGALTVRPLQRLLPDGTLTARPGPGAAVAVLGLISVAFFGAEAFVPLAVASIRGAGTLLGGLALTASAVTWAAGSWLQARLAGRGSRRALIAVGVSLIGVGIGLEAAVPLTSAAPVWLAAAAWAVSGMGMGIAFSTATLTIIESAPPGGEGAASAAIQLANTLGIGLGTGVAGGVVAFAAAGAMGEAPGIAVADLLMLVACGATLAIVGRMPDRRAEPPPGSREAIPVSHPGL